MNLSFPRQREPSVVSGQSLDSRSRDTRPSIVSRTRTRRGNDMRRHVVRDRPHETAWVVLGWAALLLVPWNAIGGRGFFAFAWLASYPLDPKVAPAAIQLLVHRRWWLLPFVAPV